MTALLVSLALTAGQQPADDWKTPEAVHLKNIKQVTADFVRAGEGYFSPDGQTIIYQAIRREYPFYQIYTQPLAGGDPKLISRGRGRTTCSYFSPDGQRILFASGHLDPNLEETEETVRRQEEEEEIAMRTTGEELVDVTRVVTAAELIELQRLVRRVPVSPSLVSFAVRLARATRPSQEASPVSRKYVAWGAGPRAGQALILGAKAHALLNGRMAASPADIRRIVKPVLRHRILTNFAAQAEGIGVERVIDDLLQRIPPPSSGIGV